MGESANGCGLGAIREPLSMFAPGVLPTLSRGAGVMRPCSAPQDCKHTQLIPLGQIWPVPVALQETICSGVDSRRVATWAITWQA